MGLEETGAVTNEGGATTADGAARLGPSPASTVILGKLFAGVNIEVDPRVRGAGGPAAARGSDRRRLPSRGEASGSGSKVVPMPKFFELDTRVAVLDDDDRLFVWSDDRRVWSEISSAALTFEGRRVSDAEALEFLASDKAPLWPSALAKTS
ncbi:hypothetical protein DKG74_01660 [Zavarzinia aquatilis]|uniref:Uncharacterized protein n=2 Tax=Zavarzinia aquatilis TaxID=2211142 RepID=A0A317EKC1_9PROT|nr:hypothetical protein DKG74_01660 [Zavarzinia aquatilis]